MMRQTDQTLGGTSLNLIRWFIDHLMEQVEKNELYLKTEEGHNFFSIPSENLMILSILKDITKIDPSKGDDLFNSASIGQVSARTERVKEFLENLKFVINLPKEYTEDHE